MAAGADAIAVNNPQGSLHGLGSAQNFLSRRSSQQKSGLKTAGSASVALVAAAGMWKPAPE